MIQGNQIWTQALAQPQKQAYYTVEIPDFCHRHRELHRIGSVATTPGRLRRQHLWRGGYGT